MNGMNNDPKNHPNWHMVDNPHCGSSLSDRIIGGVNATIGQYPWLARVGYNSKKKPRAPVMFRCGGSLINQCHVLTAAHCVTGLPPDLYVYVILNYLKIYIDQTVSMSINFNRQSSRFVQNTENILIHSLALSY